MNGKALSPEHGYPLRAIVPGWYGMASVNWLSKITATNVPFHGYWQSLEYCHFESQLGRPSQIPVTEMQIKSSIARPCFGEAIPANTSYRVHGAAWAGNSDVSKVEISTDEAKTWQLVELLDGPVAHSWRLWQFEWKVPALPGRYRLLGRATDRTVKSQPSLRDHGRRGYLINHVLPIEVNVH